MSSNMGQPIQPIQILIIEDNLDDVELVREAFRSTQLNYHLTVINNGEDALSHLRREGNGSGVALPNIILLDLNLPGKDGRELLAEIKADRKLRRIPVIVLAASQSDQDIANAYEQQANGYIAKPFSLVEFLAMARAIENWFSVVKLPKVPSSS